MAKDRNKLFGLTFLVFMQFSGLGAIAYNISKWGGLMFLWFIALALTLMLWFITNKFAHNPEDYESVK